MASVLLGHEVMAAVAEPRDTLSGLVAELAPLDGIIQRMSHLLLAQLVAGSRHRMFGVLQVLDIVRGLDGYDPGRGSARTKDGVPFKHPPLRGLHHAHWFEPRFLPANLFAHFGGAQGGNARLDDVIQSAFEKGQTAKEIAKLVSQGVVVDGFGERAAAGRLTGEWIVYRADPAGNDYLLLATHNEGDEAIAGAIRAHCEPNFVEAIQGWVSRRT